MKNTPYEEILASKYYKHYKDDNYTLYDIQGFYYPYFKVVCNCIFREKNKISIIEENFLEAINCGIKNYNKLQKFLGLDKEIFQEVAGKLHVENFFIEAPMLILTEEGKKVLHDGAKLSSVEDEHYVIIDGITGETISIDMSDEKKSDESKMKNNLRVQIPYPKNETLDRTIGNKALQTILFESIQSEDKKEREIYEIKEIIGTPYKFHKKYFSLFFKNSETPKKFLITKDGNPDDAITNTINSMELSGVNVFDFSRETENEHKQLLEELTIYKFSDINELKNGTQISTYEHPKFFEFAFKHSQREIIIISPWIKWEIIKEKQADIEDALRRGVKITFFYGMGKTSDLDHKSKDFFKKLKLTYSNQLSYSTNNDISDHSKIVICDREWLVTTSFNWTSFKGDKTRAERKERGSFINDKNEILKVIKDYSA